MCCLITPVHVIDILINKTLWFDNAYTCIDILINKTLWFLLSNSLHYFINLRQRRAWQSGTYSGTRGKWQICSGTRCRVAHAAVHVEEWHMQRHMWQSGKYAAAPVAEWNMQRHTWQSGEYAAAHVAEWNMQRHTWQSGICSGTRAMATNSYCCFCI